MSNCSIELELVDNYPDIVGCMREKLKLVINHAYISYKL